jgi:RNA polymerase sigma-70 factor, ECF subfamily
VEPRPPLPSDADLARGIAGATANAHELEAELCRRFLNRARLYGLRHLRGAVTAAEDLAQQVMVSVLEALRAGRVEDPERLDRFVLGTCRNVSLAMRRAEGKLASLRQRLSVELAGSVTPPRQGVESRRVTECLMALPPREAELLFLVFQQECSATEAAERLGTTAGNVRVIRHRALLRLRACVLGKDA